ncbi:MAG: hypothetical protein ACE149_07220 [Armatimonadota bacterium]
MSLDGRVRRKRAVLVAAILLALSLCLLAFLTEGWNVLPEGYARQFWQAMVNR